MPRARLCTIGNKRLNLSLDVSPEGPVKLLFPERRLPEAKRRWARLVEVQATGFNQHDHHGNKCTGTNPGGLLRYLSHSSSTTDLGPLWEVKQSGSGLIVSSYFQFLAKLPACRTWTLVENVGADEVLLEFVSSLALFGVSCGGASPWEEKMHLHVADTRGARNVNGGRARCAISV